MSDIHIPPSNIEELDPRILDSTITKYSDKAQLTTVLNNLKHESNSSIHEFKNIVSTLLPQIAKITNNLLIIKYEKELLNAISRHPKNIIDTFVLKAYMHGNGLFRQKLIIGDEDFFLNSDVKELASNVGEKIDEKDDVLTALFEFKNFWHKLKDENKVIFKYYLVTLCYYADIRYVCFNKYLLIKKKNAGNFESVFKAYDKEL